VISWVLTSLLSDAVADPRGFNSGCPDKCSASSVDGRHKAGCIDCVGSDIQRNANCDPANFAPITQDDVFCYGADATFTLFDAVTELWRTTNDPADPAFYSTCYFKIPAGGFIGIPPDGYTRPDWQAEELAVDCQVQASMLQPNLTQVTNWRDALAKSAAGVAADCDMMEATSSLTAEQYLASMKGADLPVAGAAYQGFGPNAVTEDGGSGDDGSSSSSLPWVLLIAAGGGAIVLALVIFFVVRWRRNKRTGLSALAKLSAQSSQQATEMTAPW
jgi:hypothetical protein